jgi:hypothetical protein
MRKSLLLVSTFLLVGLVGITSCSTSTADADTTELGNEVVLDAKQAMSFETASAVSLIPDVDTFISLKARGHHGDNGGATHDSVSTLTSEENATAKADTLATVEAYLPTIDFAYSNNQILTTNYQQTSDKEGYTYMTTIAFLNKEGTTESVSLYYNIVVSDTTSTTESSETTPTSSSDTTAASSVSAPIPSGSGMSAAGAMGDKGHNKGFTDRFDDGRDADDKEKVSIVKEEISGVVVYQNNTYEMAGRTGTNDDGVELTSFGFYLNDTDYIKVREIVDEDKQFFKYTTVSNSEVVSSYELGVFKDEEDETKTRIFFKSKELDEKEFSRFTFYTEDGVNYIKAAVKKTGYPNYTFYFKKVTAEDGTVSYEYQENMVEETPVAPTVPTTDPNSTTTTTDPNTPSSSDTTSSSTSTPSTTVPTGASTK